MDGWEETPLCVLHKLDSTLLLFPSPSTPLCSLLPYCTHEGLHTRPAGLFPLVPTVVVTLLWWWRTLARAGRSSPSWKHVAGQEAGCSCCISLGEQRVNIAFLILILRINFFSPNCWAQGSVVWREASFFSTSSPEGKADDLELSIGPPWVSLGQSDCSHRRIRNTGIKPQLSC